MKTILTITLGLLFTSGLYYGGYQHGKHRLTHEYEQAILDAIFWSEVTNLDDTKVALGFIDRETSPDLYDRVSRSFYRSAVNIIGLREQMDPEFWNLENVDIVVDGIKDFIAANPSSKRFIESLPNGEGVAPIYRKETFTELLEELNAQKKKQNKSEMAMPRKPSD